MPRVLSELVAGGKKVLKLGEVVLPDLLGAIQTPFVSQESPTVASCEFLFLLGLFVPFSLSL